MKKYEMIADTLKRSIQSGEYENKRIPTEHELGELFGVSRVTIRKSFELLEKEFLFKRSQKSGTVLLGRRAGNATKHVVFIMLFSAEESLEIIRGAEEYFSEKNISLTVKFSNCSAKSERDIIKEVLNLGADGLIIYPACCSMNIDLFTELIGRGIPLVFVDRYPMRTICASVSINNQQTASDIVNYLYGQGHRDIVFFANELKKQISTRERLLGFVSAFKLHGLELTKKNIYIFDNDAELVQAFADFFEREKLPTGIFCCDDLIASRFIDEAIRRGYRVPDDFSVVGVDDRAVASQHVPSITTVRQPFGTLGRQSAKIINSMLESKSPEITKIYLPVEFVIRDSTRAIQS